MPRESINPSQGRFVRDLIHELAVLGFEDRESYNTYLEKGIRDLLATVFGANPDIDKINLSSMVDIIFEYDFIKALFIEMEENQSEQFALDVQMLFLQVFGANETNFEAVQKLYNENHSFFLKLPQTFEKRKDILSQLLYRDNALGIVIGHMPEVSYSFLSACNSRFLGKKACKFNDGSYYVLHVGEPESFTLTEKNLKKEIFAYKDGVMTSECLSAEKFADGSIDIYLPKNGNYEYVGNCTSLKLDTVDPVSGVTPVNGILPLNGEI